MSTDCQVTIPAPARLQDVGDVIGALLGCPVSIRVLSGTGNTYAHVEGVSYRSIPDQVECVNIVIDSPAGPRTFLYHFEFDHMGNHGIMVRARSANIALCVAVCDFFGGVVDFNDVDDVDQDYRQPVREDINTEHGLASDNFQRRKLNVTPLAPADIAKYDSVASYTESNR